MIKLKEATGSSGRRLGYETAPRGHPWPAALNENNPFYGKSDGPGAVCESVFFRTVGFERVNHTEIARGWLDRGTSQGVFAFLGVFSTGGLVFYCGELMISLRLVTPANQNGRTDPTC